MSETIRIFNGQDDFLSGWQNAVMIRDELVIPALKAGKVVSLDFQGIRGTTQSWMNALVMGTLLSCGMASIQRVRFSNCSPLVRELIKFAVVQAEQRSLRAA